MRVYGYDCGRLDYDLPYNSDHEAISPVPKDDYLPPKISSPSSPSSSSQWYYSRSVPIIFPDDLQPLPQWILNDAMNLLYFHYFVNYTSTALVTSSCTSNPFRTILPRLALEDENFMGLILAYASCHRACLLDYPEPVNRIAQWVHRLFPTFREAISSGRPISDTVFGMSVMLATFSQSFPKGFDLPIPWTQHLKMAHAMCCSVASRKERPRSAASIFFLRWFGYLDTFGICSGVVYDGSDPQDWSRPLLYEAMDPSFKCLAGHTTKSLVLLSSVAQLAWRCDRQRSTKTGLPLSEMSMSQQLRCKLELRTLEIAYEKYDCSCTTELSSSQTLRSVNGALCYTALVYLHRKVHELPSDAPLVQNCVRGIIHALNSYEATVEIPDIILPLFIAACEVQSPFERQYVIERLEAIGNSGMAQVKRRIIPLLHNTLQNGGDWTTLQTEILLG